MNVISTFEKLQVIQSDLNHLIYENLYDRDQYEPEDPKWKNHTEIHRRICIAMKALGEAEDLMVNGEMESDEASFPQG